MTAQPALAERLKSLGVRGVLITMASNGQLLELKCEMPNCYCPKGQKHFDAWPTPRHSAERRWAPNADHYPTLRRDKGQLKPWNVRLAHVYCNNMDVGWRSRIRAMLERQSDLSFKEIADALNRKQGIIPPGGSKSWTAKLVRKVYTS
jgi:hypothetical protein